MRGAPLAVLFAATSSVWAASARAADVPAAAAGESGPAAGGELEAHLPASDPSFGPRYLIEDVVISGARKTKPALILREVGLHAGDVVSASDPRVEAARFRILALGFFLDVRLSLQKGSRRGAAVLLVEVEERGTIILSGLFLGTSEATALWGGLELAETNLLGRGITVSGGFVASTKPDVDDAVAGFGFRLRGAVPSVAGAPLGLSATVLATDGSEFYRDAGPESAANPADFVAVHTRRRGGILGVGTDLSRTTRLFGDLRFEDVRASLPGLRTRALDGGGFAPIDFQIHEGQSRVASVAATLDVDGRSDPVLPQSGRRLVLSIEVASPLFDSSYGFAKGVLQGSLYHRLRWGHVLGFHVLAGAVVGDAPYFDRFFVGDLNLLLPQRALGMNFSTQPSRDVLGTSVESHRYDDFAGRALVEYAVPLWRRHGFLYRGDLFAAFGILGLASLDDLRVRDRPLRTAAPIDLTADFGLRLDTYVGIFTASVGNLLGRMPF